MNKNSPSRYLPVITRKNISKYYSYTSTFAVMYNTKKVYYEYFSLIQVM